MKPLTAEDENDDEMWRGPIDRPVSSEPLTAAIEAIADALSRANRDEAFAEAHPNLHRDWLTVLDAARSATPSSEEGEDERKASEFREIEDDAPTYADGCTVPLDRDGIAIFPIPEHVHEPPLATPDNAGRAATPARSDAGDGLDVERLQRAYEACDVEFMTSAETLSSFLRRVAAEYARLSESTGSEEGR